jgi:hypothetical protein
MSLCLVKNTKSSSFLKNVPHLKNGNIGNLTDLIWGWFSQNNSAFLVKITVRKNGCMR